MSQPNKSKSASPDQTGTRILFVDDDDFYQGLVGMALSRAGYDVMVADGAEEGLDMASTQLPDLILADVTLPGMSGFTFLSMLRALTGLENVPYC